MKIKVTNNIMKINYESLKQPVTPEFSQYILNLALRIHSYRKKLKNEYI